MLPISAFAESGTITISGTTVYTYAPNTAAGSTDTALNYTRFAFYNTTFSSLAGFQFTGFGIITYANNSGFSDFTIVSGGAGSGTFYYNKTGDYLAWVFSNGIINSSQIVVSYSNPAVFNDISLPSQTGQDGSVDSTHPMAIYKSDGHIFARFNGGVPTYTANVGSYTQNSYVVTYSILNGTTYYGATITKGSLATKVQTRDVNGQQQIESTFNTNITTFFYPYGNGLYLNISLSNGLYTNQLINSSGLPAGPTPTPTPPPIPSGQVGAISFDQTSYTLGESGIITTNMDTGLFDIFSTYRIDFYSNTIPLISQFSVDTSQTSQIFPVSFSSPGTYTALLVKSTPLFGDSIQATATASVSIGVSSISINNTVPYHTQVPVNYSFGVANITLNYAIQTYYLNPSTGMYDFEHSFFGLSQNGTANVYFEKVGTYILKLKNVPQNIVYAQTSTQTTFASPQITITISKSALNISKTTYYYGDTIFGNYTIDSTNWSNGQLYLSVYNYDKSLTTAIMQGSGAGWTDVSSKQQGDLLVTLLNVPASENFQETNFISGSNALRLMVRYANGTDAILAYQNFTLSDITTTGYGLRLSKYSVLENEKFTAYVTVPENGARLILVNTGTDSTKGLLLASIGVNQSPATIPVSISKAGNYAIILNNPSNDTEIMQNVVVTSAPAQPSQTPPPNDMVNTANDLLAVLSNIAFYGFVIWLGIISGTIAMMVRYGGQVSGTGIVFVGWLAAIFISLIGLFGEFKIYIIVISTIIAALMFYAGRKIAVEGQ